MRKIGVRVLTTSTDEKVLLVPARPSASGTKALYELRQEPGGPLTALVFTTLERLVAGCGEHQPWVAVATSTLIAELTEAGVVQVLIDADVTPAARWTAEGPAPAAAGTARAVECA